jgi:hypothetical protein
VALPRSRIVSATICCNSAAFTAWGRLLIQHRDLRTQIEFLARVAAQMGEPNRAIAATGVRLSFSTEVVASTFRDVDFDITRLIALDLEKGQEEQRTEK